MATVRNIEIAGWRISKMHRMQDSTSADDRVVEMSHRAKSPLFKVTGAHSQGEGPDVDRLVHAGVEHVAKVLGW